MRIISTFVSSVPATVRCDPLKPNRVKYSALFGLLLGWLVSADAQTFHVQPANPVLVGEPVSLPPRISADRCW